MQTNEIQRSDLRCALEAMVHMMQINSEALRALAARNAAMVPKPGRVISGPRLLSHFMAIRSLLEAHEVAQILALGDRTSEEQLQWLLDQVSALPVDKAVALLRNTLVELDQTKFTPPTQ